MIPTVAETRNKSGGGARGGKSPPPLPDAAVPRVPPMQDRGLPWWPFVAALAGFLAWLIFLAVLAMHSDRWRPG